MLASPLRLFYAFSCMPLLLICAVELLSYYRWRTKAKKAAERGEFLATPNTSKFQTAILALVLAGFVWWFVNVVYMGSIALFLDAAMLLVTAALIALLIGVRSLLKRRGAPKNLNRGITFSVYFVAGFFLFGAVVLFGIRAVGSGLLEFRTDTNRSRFLAGDPPLSVADLMDINMDSYMTRRGGDESFLLARYDVPHHQWGRACYCHPYSAWRSPSR